MKEIATKTVLFIGGGRANLGAIKSAKDMDLRTIVAGKKGDYPCNKYADVLIDVDISDRVQLADAIADQDIDGAVVCCNDWVLPSLGYVNDKYGWKGITYKNAVTCSNKGEIKKILVENGVSTARHYIIYNETDIEKCLAAGFNFPVMIKAVDLQSSKGIYKCDDIESLKEKYKEVCGLTHSPYCIIEEFIEGREIGAQAFVYEGEVLLVIPHGDIISHYGPVSAPTGHYMPLDINDEEKRLIETETKKAIKALSLNNCAVNIDFIIRDGVPYVLELSGRVGANCLPELTSHYLGIDYYKMIISTAIGDDPKCHLENRHHTGKCVFSKMLTSEKNGKFVKADCMTDNVAYMNMFVKEGDDVHVFRNSGDCIGEVLVEGNDMNMCMAKMLDFEENLTIEVL